MLRVLIWVVGFAALIALPHGLSFSQQEILVFLTINLGLGVAVLVAAVGLAVWFRRGLEAAA